MDGTNFGIFEELVGVVISALCSVNSIVEFLQTVGQTSPIIYLFIIIPCIQ